MLYANRKQSGPAKGSHGAGRQVNDTARNEGAAVVNANVDSMPGALIAHTHMTAERQGPMSC